MSRKEKLDRAIEKFNREADALLALYCPTCGMFEPKHWAGCPRGKK